RQLARQDDLADALDQLRLVHRVGNAVDVDGPGRSRLRSDVPGAAQPDAALAGLVDLRQLVARVENLPSGGKIGAFDVAAQLRAAQFVVVEQPGERIADLGEIVRRHVGGHADGDAGGAVH